MIRAVGVPLRNWLQRRWFQRPCLRRKVPTLSIVIPVYNTAKHLAECLDSVLGQHYRNIDVVIIDDGSKDDSLAIARRYAAVDARIMVMTQPNAGASAARNAAIARATGDFLTFVDADDTVTRHGLAESMRTLVSTGSDIAVMPYQRLNDQAIRQPAKWIRDLHATTRLKSTLEESPDVMVNAIACAKLFRRDFWDRAGLRFLPGVIYEDQILTAEAYREAAAIDILATPAYNWRVQESSVSQGQVTVHNVLARLDSAEQSLALLESLPAVRAERALQLLRYNMVNSVLKLERADDDYLDVLIEHLPALVDAAPAADYTAIVPAQFRVLYELIRNGDRDLVWDFVRAEGMQVEMHPSGVEAAGFVAYLPGWGRDPVPAEAYVLTQEQTAFQARILRAHRLGAREFALDVQAWFQNVDIESSLQAIVRADGAVLDTEVRRNGIDVVVNSRQGAERRYRGSGWTVTVGYASRSLPKFLDIELPLTAGPFVGARTFAKFRSARVESL